MRIDAICVCEGYGDFLRYTLPQMQIMFDSVLVVTSGRDIETAEVCIQNCNPFFIVDPILRNGRFEKGRAINDALRKRISISWLAVVDADIWIPSTFGREIRDVINCGPDALEKAIIGVPRRIVSGFDRFRSFATSVPARLARNPGMCFEREPTRFREGMPLPLGYFQMWKPVASKIYEYSMGHTLEEVEDARFALQWNPMYRYVVPELCVYHLQTDGHYDMQDWNGRKQPRFGPEV